MRGMIEGCVGRPVAVVMALSALLLAALRSAAELPVEKLPDLSVPRVAVECSYPGLSAEDIRSVLTLPVEDALSSVRGLERLRSVSRPSSAVIVLDFAWGTDPSAASVLVREAIDSVYTRLPEGAEKPKVLPGEGEGEPLAVVGLRSRSGDAASARVLAEYELRSRFRRIDGVAAVVLSGGVEREAALLVDPRRVHARGLGPLELARTIASEWVNVPAGNAREGDMELVMVAAGRPESVEALSRSVLPAPGGPFVPGEDGELVLRNAKRRSVFVADGEAVTALELFRKPGSDPLALSRSIDSVLAGAVSDFSRDFELTLLYDGSAEIRSGLGDLARSALLAAAAVVLTLAVFLRSLRGSLLAALSIPVSAAAALCALALGGRSLNAMSLGGLALGVGLVSDTAVVVLDLLVRRFGGERTRPAPTDMAAAAATLSASSFGSTATTAVVFLPVVFLPGPLGALYGDLSLSLVSSIAASWLYSQLALPALYRLTLPSKRSSRSGVRRFFLEARYRRLLRACFRNPLAPIAVSAVLTLLGAAALLTAPLRFVPPEDAAELAIAVDFPSGTDLDALEREGRRLSRLAAEQDGVAAVFGRAGAEAEDLLRRSSLDYRRERLLLRCILAKGADPETVLSALRNTLGAGILLSLPQDRLERLLGLSSAHTLVARGSGLEEAEERWSRAAALLRTGGGAAAVTRLPAGERTELRLTPRREAAAATGISTAAMAESLRTATEGQVAARLELEGRPLDVRVAGTAPPAALRSEDYIASHPLQASSSAPVFLGSVAAVERRTARAALARLDRSDAVYLEVRPGAGKGRELSAALDSAAKTVPGIGRADESVFRRYGSSLTLTVVLVLILLYLTLGAQFESFSLPLLLMACIPLALSGSGPAIRAASGGLDSGSVIGLVVLFGLAVNNGIVLYEISRDGRAGGLGAVAAAYRGASDRLRPVLATACTTVFALIPVVFAPLGAGQRSMAAAMLGGVAASTLLALFVLPPIFARFLRGRR